MAPVSSTRTAVLTCSIPRHLLPFYLLVVSVGVWCRLACSSRLSVLEGGCGGHYSFLSPAAESLHFVFSRLKPGRAEMDGGDCGGGAATLPIRMTKALEERSRAVFSQHGSHGRWEGIMLLCNNSYVCRGENNPNCSANCSFVFKKRDMQRRHQ